MNRLGVLIDALMDKRLINREENSTGVTDLVDAKLSQDVQANNVRILRHTVKKPVGFMVHIVR